MKGLVTVEAVRPTLLVGAIIKSNGELPLLNPIVLGEIMAGTQQLNVLRNY